MQQEAKAELFGLAVKAFGDPAAYTQWEFAQGLPENIDLKMIYSGPGTLWTDLKGVVPTLNVKPEQKRIRVCKPHTACAAAETYRYWKEPTYPVFVPSKRHHRPRAGGAHD